MAIVKPNISGAFQAGAATPFSTATVDWGGAIKSGLDAYNQGLQNQLNQIRIAKEKKEAEEAKLREDRVNASLAKQGIVTASTYSRDQRNAAIQEGANIIAGAETKEDRKRGRKMKRDARKKYRAHQQAGGIIYTDSDADDMYDTDNMTLEDKELLAENLGNMPDDISKMQETAKVKYDELMGIYNPSDPAHVAAKKQLESIIKGDISPMSYDVINGKFKFGITSSVQAKNEDGSLKFDDNGQPVYENVQEEINLDDINTSLTGVNETISTEQVGALVSDEIKTGAADGTITELEYKQNLRSGIRKQMKTPGQKLIFGRDLLANDEIMSKLGVNPKEYDLNGDGVYSDDEIMAIPNEVIIEAAVGAGMALVPEGTKFATQSTASIERDTAIINNETAVLKNKETEINLGKGGKKSTHIKNVEFDNAKALERFDNFAITITPENPLGDVTQLIQSVHFNKGNILDVKYVKGKGYRFVTKDGNVPTTGYYTENQYKNQVATWSGGRKITTDSGNSGKVKMEDINIEG